MDFRLLDRGWDAEMMAAMREIPSTVRLVCPFIQIKPIQRLLQYGQPSSFEIITRFNLDDFSSGVSDPAALRLLLSTGARIRGVRGLHAKLYILGDRALLTSANLTDAGLHDNHEFGFISLDPNIVWKCGQYFTGLWHRAGDDLAASMIDEWETELQRASSGNADVPKLGDRGTMIWPQAEDEDDSGGEEWVPGPQAFIKFFGETENRAPASGAVEQEIDRSGSHWALTYSKRPTGVRDNARMFMSRLIESPHDIVIYGRAIGMQHRPGRDDATASDIQRRPWKERWPHYIRVSDPEFISGTLQNGVFLSDLKARLGLNSFASTKRNAARGRGNTDPNRAYLQQGAVRLTPEAAAWLTERFDAAVRKHGTLTKQELMNLDWPPEF